jgi:hypothetical protein
VVMMNLKTQVIRQNFLELFWFLAKHNEEIDKVALENAHENHRMTTPNI